MRPCRWCAFVSGDAMVFLDEGVKYISENSVGVRISSVDTTVLIIKLYSTGDGLAEGEPGGLGLLLTELVPEGLRHVLGNKRLLGLDFRKPRHCRSSGD